MPLRSVLSIDVDDTQFKAYTDAFAKYEAAVKKMPAAWGAVGASVGKGAKTFSEMVGAAVALTYHQKQQAAAQKEADRLTRSMADRWRDIGRSTKDFAGNIASATGNLIKWIGPISALTGLLGAGVGLFGLERLANSVSGQRRSATGLGIGYGQQAAFGLNYGRFVDTQSLLSGVSGSLYNATSPGYTGLLAAGISHKFLETHNAADVSVELLHRLPDLLKGTPQNLRGARLASLGLDSVISPEDANRYVNSSASERADQDMAYRKDISRLDLKPEDQRVWQDFINQLERAGKGIESTFARALPSLGVSIGKLSDAFEKAVDNFVGSDAVKAAIEGLAGYLGSTKLLSDIETFGRYMAYAAEKLVGVARWLGLIPSESRAFVKTGFGALDSRFGADFTPSYTRDQSMRSQFGDMSDVPFGGAANLFNATKAVAAANDNLGAAANAISGIEGNYGSIGPATKTGDHGYGRYQVMGANVAAWTQKYYGKALTPEEFLADKAAQDAVFRGQFGTYEKKYGTEGAARAWFAGERGMNNPNARDVNGTTVSSYSQQFTAGYKQHDPYQTRQPAPYFNVYDATGGNVNITTSQGAHGF